MDALQKYQNGQIPSNTTGAVELATAGNDGTEPVPVIDALLGASGPP